MLVRNPWSGWQWFDSPCHLAGYLLHVGIPDLAAWWFDESSYRDLGGRMPLATLSNLRLELTRRTVPSSWLSPTI